MFKKVKKRQNAKTASEFSVAAEPAEEPIVEEEVIAVQIEPETNIDQPENGLG